MGNRTIRIPIRGWGWDKSKQVNILEDWPDRIVLQCRELGESPPYVLALGLVDGDERRMSKNNPTNKERLATLEANAKSLDRYVRNDIKHAITRVELAVYGLVVGGLGTLLAYNLGLLGG